MQKGKPLADEEFKSLKSKKLVEGRRQNLFVTAEIAAITDNKESYIRNRAFDRDYYQELVIAYLKKYGEATRSQIDRLLEDKLSDSLDKQQKKYFVTNLLQEMKRQRRIQPSGTTRWVKWKMSVFSPGEKSDENC